MFESVLICICIYIYIKKQEEATKCIEEKEMPENVALIS